MPCNRFLGHFRHFTTNTLILMVLGASIACLTPTGFVFAQASTLSGDHRNTIIDLSALTDQDTVTEISQDDIIKSRALRQLTPAKSVLCKYRKNTDGMFSQTWAAYILSDDEGNKDDRYIELNGRRLGPFDQVSKLISFSPNGNKVAFAAKEKGKAKWNVYLDGKAQSSHDGLYWATYTWPLNLEETRILNESNAVVLQYAPDNSTVAYFSERKDGAKTSWAVVCNGAEGQYYTGVSTPIRFIGGQTAYWAWKGKDIFLVVGPNEYGPYKRAWGLKVSQDSKHFIFAAEKDGAQKLIVDGKEVQVPGEVECTAIGNAGAYATAYQQEGVIEVIQNGAKWPTSYSETVWHQLRMSHDGKTLAGWFRKGGKWYVVINGKIEYGPHSSYYIIKAGDIYGLFLGRAGDNVGYFTRLVERRSTGCEFFLNGKKIKNGPSFGLWDLTVYQDESGEVEGVGKMGEVNADMAAVADAAAAGAENPLKARYVGSHLIYSIEKNDLAWVVADQKKLGPYSGAGTPCSSPKKDHYAFVARNQEGMWVVVDGSFQTPYFPNIYRLQFSSNDEIAFLTVEEGNIVRVSCKIPPSN